MSADRAAAGTVCVYGLWHLGSVTAACLAAEGARVVGLDPDERCISELTAGRPPIAEPGLAELVQGGLVAGRLSFTTDPAEALADADILWVAFDTPVDDDDRADVDRVRAQLEAARPHVRPGTLALISSQVPVGFTAEIERSWRQTDPTLQFACSPENLRLGQAIRAFRQPARIVVGLGEAVERERLARLLGPFSDRIIWMSLESAEMTKHALNGFLALSIAYTNELARLCERIGADASEVERGLRSEPRIGPSAYVTPGPPIAGGTLLRDIGLLSRLASEQGLESPVVDAVPVSNRLHQGWALRRALDLLDGIAAPRAAVLGLTYKPGTDTLRRSSALELARALVEHGVRVSAYDPALRELPPTLAGINLTGHLDAALVGADVAVLATAWQEFRALTGDRLVARMRRPCLIDEAGFLPHLADDARLLYARVGRPLLGSDTPGAPVGATVER